LTDGWDSLPVVWWSLPLVWGILPIDLDSLPVDLEPLPIDLESLPIDLEPLPIDLESLAIDRGKAAVDRGWAAIDRECLPEPLLTSPKGREFVDGCLWGCLATCTREKWLKPFLNSAWLLCPRLKSWAIVDRYEMVTVLRVTTQVANLRQREALFTI